MSSHHIDALGSPLERGRDLVDNSGVAEGSTSWRAMAEEEHRDNDRLQAPRPLLDPHQRCITPPRPAGCPYPTKQRDTPVECSFLQSGIAFSGHQYYTSHEKTGKRKPRRERVSERSRRRSPADELGGRFESLLEGIDFRGLLSMQRHRQPPLQPEPEVEADSDAEQDMATESHATTIPATAQDELLASIRRLRQVTQETADQLALVYDTLPSLKSTSKNPVGLV